MDNPINGMVLDLVAETARETRDLGGLEALSLFLDKFSERPGLVTQSNRLAAVKRQIEQRTKEINAGANL